MGRPSYSNVDDTLLAHHAFASHLPQKLDQVVSEYCDAAPWKVQHGMRDVGEKGAVIESMGGKELCLYNGQDCRLTALAWTRMQDDLKLDREVYEYDRQLARICSEMQWVGVGVDVGRRSELIVLLKERADGLKGELRSLCGKSTFEPSKLGEVREVLFEDFGATGAKKTETGVPSTNDETLELLSGDTQLGQFCQTLLQWRLVGKILSTYLEAVKVRMESGEGRAHYNWKPFGTVSGRLACRVQSCPRWNPKTPEGRAREIYVPKKGHKFVYFDVSQAEMRLAAFISNDPVFMKVATSSDVHAGNARAVFPDIAAKGWLDGKELKDPEKGKPYRDIAKNLGFAIAYGAEAAKVYTTLVSKGFPVTMRAVELILGRLRTAYRVYSAYAEENVERVKEVGYLRSPVMGRIRWFGRFPRPTDIANYPVQSSLADIVNMRMIRGFREFPEHWNLVMQIHDACIYEVPDGEVENCKDRIQAMWDEPIHLAGGPLVLPIDLKVGERWSEL